MEQRKLSAETEKRIENRVEVYSTSRIREEAWGEMLVDAFGTIGFEPESVEFSHGVTSGYSEICIVDSRIPHVGKMLMSLSRSGRSVFLLMDEMDDGTALNDTVFSNIDDVLIYPFRIFELEGKIRLHQSLRAWSDVDRMNISFRGMLASLSDDVALAERLQKRSLPLRFPTLKGFRARSRYLAGMRSGGDHFDIAESKDGSRVSLVLSDSSSYGLASAFLNSLMRVAMKLSQDEVRSATETVRLIQSDLAQVLGEKDHLSLIYGVVSRKDLRLRFLHLGSSVMFHSVSGGNFQVYSGTSPAIRQSNLGQAELVEREIELSANDRLVLLSDGYVERAGGVDASQAILDSLRSKDSEDSLNEFTFRVKKRFQDNDDMPEQDCTAVVLDVDSKVLKLA